jgi:hypothetical protein
VSEAAPEKLKERTSMCDGLLIEGEDACNLAAELADLTGDDLRTAVMTALREGIAREHARLARQERIMAITREIARSARYGAGVRQVAAH